LKRNVLPINAVDRGQAQGQPAGGNQTYYYLVESARVDGKPRIVSQQYLGSADEVMAKVTDQQAGSPVRTQHKRFGDLAAVCSVLERLRVADIVDAVVPRRADALASRGAYIALAVANRVVAPCSKLAFADWWESTAGPRWTQLPAAAVGPWNFSRAMDRLSSQALREIEGELFRRMVEEYGLDLSGLVLDMTNFATFIDSANDRAPIAQRGKAKQKRVDLPLVGLGLVVTRDGGIPLFSHAYPGDRPDVTQFATMLDELIARYGEFTGTVTDLTLVYDAGQNSAANHALVEDCGIGFVGSLPPSDHLALLKLTARAYQPVDEDRFPGVTCVDTTVTALGVTRRAVLTHSPTLHQAQHRGLDQTLAKARSRLGDLQARLARGNTRKDRTAVEAEITTILKARWAKEVIEVTLVGERPSDLRLAFRTDQGTRPPGAATVRQADPVRQPHLVEHSRGRGRLPLAGRCRIGLPPVEGPSPRLLQPAAPLDRPENPSPRLLLPSGPGGRAPHAPTSRAGRTAPVRTRTFGPARRNRRDRPALPRRRQGPSASPAHAYGHERDTAHPGRPLRHPTLCTNSLTRNDSDLGNTAGLSQTGPEQRKRPHVPS
jgi:transposase